MQKLALLALAGSACGSLVDGDYAGDPILQLHGVATGRSTRMPTAGAQAAAAWQSDRVEGVVELTRLPLEQDFPSFWVDFLAPPPAAARIRLAAGEPAFAEAALHIVVGAAPRFLATDYDHVVVWVGDAMAADGPTARYLGAALAPGFHVATRHTCTELTAPQQLVVARCVATADDVPADRALGTCTAQHLYELAPAPDDLETTLAFRVIAP
jgi:hypothetical protein